MRKLFITLLVVLGVSTGVSAQEVGKIWVGGSVAIGHSSIKGNGEKSSGFNFKVMPEIGYVFSENISMGINLGYGKTKVGVTDDFQGYETNVDQFIVSPFVRYTYLRSNLVSLFVDGTVGYTYAKNKDADKMLKSYEAGVKPGIALHASDKVNFVAKVGFLGYRHSKYDGLKVNDFGLNADLSNIELGVNVFF